MESSVKWSKDSLLWTTPWGEEMRDWETDADSADYAECRRFAILGKNDLKL